MPKLCDWLLMPLARVAYSVYRPGPPAPVTQVTRAGGRAPGVPGSRIPRARPATS
jgi:hypothetical protein